MSSDDRLREALAGYDAQYSLRPIGEQNPDLPDGAVERVEAVVEAARAALLEDVEQRLRTWLPTPKRRSR